MEKDNKPEQKNEQNENKNDKNQENNSGKKNRPRLFSRDVTELITENKKEKK